MAKALRDGFILPLPLCKHFLAAAIGEDLALAALPQPGDGYVGEFVGAAARFALELRRRHVGLEGDARKAAYRAETRKPNWGKEFLQLEVGGASDWSFDQYVQNCCITFRETGLSGDDLCCGGCERALDAEGLDEFAECVVRWWLVDGITPQVTAFRQGVEDVCASSAVWAFEATELSTMLCGGHVDWTREQLQQCFRPQRGVDAHDVEMLVDALQRMNTSRREQFLEFVTACPRLPPGGLGATHIILMPANPPGSLPRARTCTKELRLPKYDTVDQLEDRLFFAMEHAEGLYDDERML